MSVEIDSHISQNCAGRRKTQGVGCSQPLNHKKRSYPQLDHSDFDNYTTPFKKHKVDTSSREFNLNDNKNCNQNKNKNTNKSERQYDGAKKYFANKSKQHNKTRSEWRQVDRKKKMEKIISSSVTRNMKNNEKHSGESKFFEENMSNVDIDDDVVMTNCRSNNYEKLCFESDCEAHNHNNINSIDRNFGKREHPMDKCSLLHNSQKRKESRETKRNAERQKRLEKKVADASKKNKNRSNHCHRENANIMKKKNETYNDKTNLNNKENYSSCANLDIENDNKSESELQNHKNKSPSKAKNEINDNDAKENQRKESERIIMQRSCQRLQDLKNQDLNEKREEELKQKIRENLQPKLDALKSKYHNNPIGLLSSLPLNPKLDSPKDIGVAFKRALTFYHPDKQIHEKLEKKIENEEMFKFISIEKENWAKMHNNKHCNASNNNNSYYTPQPNRTYSFAQNYNQHPSSYKNNKTQWF